MDKVITGLIIVLVVGFFYWLSQEEDVMPVETMSETAGVDSEATDMAEAAEMAAAEAAAAEAAEMAAAEAAAAEMAAAEAAAAEAAEMAAAEAAAAEAAEMAAAEAAMAEMTAAEAGSLWEAVIGMGDEQRPAGRYASYDDCVAAVRQMVDIATTAYSCSQ